MKITILFVISLAISLTYSAFIDVTANLIVLPPKEENKNKYLDLFVSKNSLRRKNEDNFKDETGEEDESLDSKSFPGLKTKMGDSMDDLFTTNDKDGTDSIFEITKRVGKDGKSLHEVMMAVQDLVNKKIKVKSKSGNFGNSKADLLDDLKSKLAKSINRRGKKKQDTKNTNADKNSLNNKGKDKLDETKSQSNQGSKATKHIEIRDPLTSIADKSSATSKNTKLQNKHVSLDKSLEINKGKQKLDETETSASKNPTVFRRAANVIQIPGLNKYEKDEDSKLEDANSMAAITVNLTGLLGN